MTILFPYMARSVPIAKGNTMFRILILALAMVAVAFPATADQGRNGKSWRELVTEQGYLPGHGRGRTGPPRVAPPVVVAPSFGNSRTRQSLPATCIDDIETRDGWRRIYDRDCLADWGTDTRALPRICNVQLTTWGGMRRGYDAQCLVDAGYRRR
jgi:hypothetical protein